MITSARFRVGETVLGLFTFGLGLFIAIDTWRQPSSVAQSVVGPGLFPVIIAVGLAIVGLRLLYEGYLHRFAKEDIPELDWRAVIIVALALASQIFLLEHLGWIVSGTAIFTISAWAFGSRRHVLNVLFGIALTSITYLVFDYGLDLDLPTGTLIEDFMARPDGAS